VRFHIVRRIFLFWIALGFGLLIPSRAAWAANPAAPAAATTTSATLDVTQSLKEMAELEGQIEAAQRRQFEEQRRLLEANRSLQSVNSTLERKGALAREGEQFLQAYGDQARAGVQSVEERIEADRQAIGASRSALNQARAALLAGGMASGRSTADLLALGLLQEAHRDRAPIASRRILELETQRTELAGKSEHAAQAYHYQSVFSQYSLQQLRERHQALASQVAEGQAHADEQSRQVAQLASRHGELKQLIARLAEQEAVRAAQPTPAPTTTPVPTPVTATPPATTVRPLPTPLGERTVAAVGEVVPAQAPLMAATGGAGATEVPYEEGSGPLIGAIRTTEDKDQTDPSGTRYLFWRAKPVGVCALAGGKVLFSGSFAGYRHLLIIDHGDGWRSLYGNLAQCALAPGGTVQAGQVLGQYQAVQGTRAEPLWFEVRQGVQAVAAESWPAMPAQWQGRLLSHL
jgi:septal ring factor EnvC (AmiA/AmiB activator)